MPSSSSGTRDSTLSTVRCVGQSMRRWLQALYILRNAIAVGIVAAAVVVLTMAIWTRQINRDTANSHPLGLGHPPMAVVAKFDDQTAIAIRKGQQDQSAQACAVLTPASPRSRLPFSELALEFTIDCDGKPIVASPDPNTVPDAARTCHLPQYGMTENNCVRFLGDGDCDEAQYTAGVVYGKGRKVKRARLALKKSPNFNCKEFDFDFGDCRQPTAEGEVDAKVPETRQPWQRFRQPLVSVTTAHLQPAPSLLEKTSKGGVQAGCFEIQHSTLRPEPRTNGSASNKPGGTTPSHRETVPLHRPVSTRTGIRGKYLQYVCYRF